MIQIFAVKATQAVRRSRGAFKRIGSAGALIGNAPPPPPHGAFKRIGNAPARAALSSKLPVLLVTYFFDFLPSNGDFP